MVFLLYPYLLERGIMSIKNAPQFKFFKKPGTLHGCEQFKRDLRKFFKKPTTLKQKTYSGPIRREVDLIIYSLMENSIICQDWISIEMAVAGVGIKKAIYRLENSGYITILLGTEDSGLCTRIRFTTKWYSRLRIRETKPFKVGDLKFCLVEVDADGKEVESRLGKEHYRVKIIMQLIKNLEGNIFETPSRKIESANFSMRVNEAKKELGRLYTYHFQSISSEDRKRLMVNGKPTEEIDYSAMHPTLLYRFKGLQFNGKPYDIEGGIRPLTKLVFLISLNCSGGRGEVIKAVTATDDFHELAYEQTKLQLAGQFVENQEFRDLLKEKRAHLRELTGKTFDQLIELHKPIAEFLGTGVARQCFWHESEIIFQAIRSLQMKVPGIILIPVHDSLICTSEFTEVVKHEMSLALLNHPFSK